MTPAPWIRGTVAILLLTCGLTLMNSLGSLQLPTVMAYSGLVVFCAGIVTVFLPSSWSGFPKRIYGFLTGVVIGGLLFAAGWFWPPHSTRITTPSTHLDAFMPSYDFHERHALVIQAPADRVREALNKFSFGDLRAVQILGTVRSIALGRYRRAPVGGTPHVPLLQMMHDPQSGFFPLDESGPELVFGMAGRPWNNATVHLTPAEFLTWARPGNVKIAFNFLIEDIDGHRTRVVTETRVAANDEFARRTMAKYWTLIYPGTAMIRRGLLGAIRTRAENATEKSNQG